MRARAPGHQPLGRLDAHVRDGLGVRPLLDGVLLVLDDGIPVPQVGLERVADRVQAAVALRGEHLLLLAAVEHRNGRNDAVLLLEVRLHHVQRVKEVDVGFHKDGQYIVALHLPVLAVGNALDGVPEVLAHARGQVVAVAALQHVADAALARLAVDADDVALVLPADVRRVDGQIRHRPPLGRVLLAPAHALGDGVLVPARERREHQLPGVGLPLIDVHARHVLIGLHQLRHVFQVQARVHALRVHVQRNGQYVRVAGALAVAEQRALHAVRARQQAHLRVRDGAAAVVVRVQRHNHVLPAVQVVAHVLNLVGVHVRHGQRHRRRQIDDHRPLGRGLPNVQHRVAHLGGKLRLRAGERLRRVFKPDVAARHHLAPQLLAQLGSAGCNAHNLLAAHAVHLLALRNRRGVVQVHDGVLHALQRLIGAPHDVLAALREHLHRHILGDEPALDERAQKQILGIRRGGKAHLDLLEPGAHQRLEILDLLVQAHGHHQRLVAVAQIDGAPHGRMLDVVARRPPHGRILGRIVLDAVFAHVFHVAHPRFVG